MLNIGMTELLVFGIIALLVLGPDKLPEAARFSGKWYGKLKRLVSNVQNDIDRELRMSELKEQLHNEMKRIQDLEHKMQAQMQALKQQKPECQNDNPKTALSDHKNFSPIYIYVEHTKSKKYALKQAGVFRTSQPKYANMSKHQVFSSPMEVSSSPMMMLQEAV